MIRACVGVFWTRCYECGFKLRARFPANEVNNFRETLAFYTVFYDTYHFGLNSKHKQFKWVSYFFIITIQGDLYLIYLFFFVHLCCSRLEWPFHSWHVFFSRILRLIITMIYSTDCVFQTYPNTFIYYMLPCMTRGKMNI